MAVSSLQTLGRDNTHINKHKNTHNKNIHRDVYKEWPAFLISIHENIGPAKENMKYILLIFVLFVVCFPNCNETNRQGRTFVKRLMKLVIYSFDILIGKINIYYYDVFYEFVTDH